MHIHVLYISVLDILLHFHYYIVYNIERKKKPTSTAHVNYEKCSMSTPKNRILSESGTDSNKLSPNKNFS